MQSAQVIEHLSRSTSPARVFLKGNHEDRMLAFLSDPAANGAGWLDYGGREALASYGLSITDEPDADGWVQLRDLLNQQLPPAHLQSARARLEHERRRRDLPRVPIARIPRIVAAAARGDYRHYSRGGIDVLRDLVQPAPRRSAAPLEP